MFSTPQYDEYFIFLKLGKGFKIGPMILVMDSGAPTTRGSEGATFLDFSFLLISNTLFHRRFLFSDLILGNRFQKCIIIFSVAYGTSVAKHNYSYGFTYPFNIACKLQRKDSFAPAGSMITEPPEVFLREVILGDPPEMR